MSTEYERLKAQADEFEKKAKAAIEQPLLAEIELLKRRVDYWRSAAYMIHNEACTKEACMEPIEKGQP